MCMLCRCVWYVLYRAKDTMDRFWGLEPQSYVVTCIQEHSISIQVGMVQLTKVHQPSACSGWLTTTICLSAD